MRVGSNLAPDSVTIRNVRLPWSSAAFVNLQSP